MMRAPFGFLAFSLIIMVSFCLAQRRSDPLTQPEIDQLRDAAIEPEMRMKLYVQFARARLVSLEQMRAVYRSVLIMLRVKMVPAAEVADRLDEAFTRSHTGAYPVDRQAVEAGIRDGVDAELAGRVRG